MQDLTDKSYVYNAYNSLLKRLKGGVFVKKVISDWNSKKNDKSNKKIFLYAGHDSSVTNILAALNVWTEQFPDYGNFYKNNLKSWKKPLITCDFRCNRHFGIFSKPRKWTLWSGNLSEKFP